MVSLGSTVDGHYNRTATRNVVVIWGGINDVVVNGSSAADIYALYQTYCADRHAAGWKVVMLTMLPNASVSTATREALNALIRADHSFADGLADVAADDRIGVTGANLLTTYYDADHVHMNDAGYAIVAGIVNSAIDGLY